MNYSINHAMNFIFRVLGPLSLGIIVSVSSAVAAESTVKTVPAKSSTSPKASKPAAVDPGKGFRKKDISFEERVIEGMSGRNYESLSQTGTTEGAVGDRLYRKRANFDEESKTLLREMEYLK